MSRLTNLFTYFAFALGACLRAEFGALVPVAVKNAWSDFRAGRPITKRGKYFVAYANHGGKRWESDHPTLRSGTLAEWKEQDTKNNDAREKAREEIYSPTPEFVVTSEGISVHSDETR